MKKDKILKYITFILAITATIALILITNGKIPVFSSNNSKPGVAAIENNKTKAITMPDYSEYCTVGNYKNLTYTLNDTYAYSDEQMKLHEQLIDNTTFKDLVKTTEIINKPVQFGDTVKITYKGTVDNKSFDGSDSANDGIKLIVGYSDAFSDEFMNALIGMNLNEVKNITIKYDNNTDSSLAGKTVVYKTTIKQISQDSLPEITDAETAKYTDNKYTTYKEYHNAVIDQINNQLAIAKKNDISNQLLTEIIKSSTYTSMPEKEIKKLVNDSVKLAKERAKSYNMSDDDYVNQYYGTATMDDYTTYMQSQAEEYMKAKIVICLIASNENITISQSDIATYKTYLSNYYSLDSDDNINNYMTSNDIKFECLADKVQTYLAENAKQSGK